MKTHISRLQYEAVNNILNELHCGFVVYFATEMGFKEIRQDDGTLRALLLSFDDCDIVEDKNEMFPAMAENCDGRTVYEFVENGKNPIVVQVAADDIYTSVDAADLCADDEGLTAIEVTEGLNGYPKNIGGAVIGFSSLNEAEIIAEKYGFTVDVFRKRDGWHLWERAGRMTENPDNMTWRDDVWQYAIGLDCEI